MLASDNVSAEALVLSSCARMGLGESVDAWAEKICELVGNGRASGCMAALAAAGYEINQSAKMLQESYLSLYEEALR